MRGNGLKKESGKKHRIILLGLFFELNKPNVYLFIALIALVAFDSNI
jgi:hypothetical protein